MKKRKKTISIRWILVWVYSILMVAIVGGMGLYVNHVTTSYFIETAREYNEQLTAQASVNINTYFEGVNEALERFVSDEDVYEAVAQEKDLDDYDRYLLRKRVQSQLTTLLSTQKTIRWAFIMSDNGYIFSDTISGVPKMDEPIIEELEATYKEEETAPIHYYSVMPRIYGSPGNDSLEIPVSQGIRDFSSFGSKNKGVVVASLSLSQLDTVFAELEEKNGFTSFIIDEDGKIYYSSDLEYVGERKEKYLEDHGITKSEEGVMYDESGSVQFLFNDNELSVNDWHIVVLANMDDLEGRFHAVSALVFAITIGAIVLAVFAGWMVAFRVTKPLMLLTKEMDRVSGDHLGVSLEGKTMLAEIDSLYKRYNKMQGRIQDLIDQVYYEKMRQKEAQYEALQSKISPHFLYNSLQTINSLCMLNRSEEAQEAVNALAEMLEYLVYENNEKVTLDRELSHIESYLKLQKMRYYEQFSVALDIDPGCRECVISKLMIQPVVENAVIHGLAPRQGGGILEISAGCRDGILTVTVKDNGVGMSQEETERLYSYMNSEDRNSEKKSIGLSNIQERIRLKFGSGYGITIESKEGEGTRITIRMPAVYE